MAFIKGVSGNPSGRPKVPAIPKSIETEVRALCRRLFDAEYWARTKRLLMRGELNPRLEIVLLSYAYGPSDKETTSSGVTVNVGFIQGVSRHNGTLTIDVPQLTEPASDTALADPRTITNHAEIVASSDIVP